MNIVVNEDLKAYIDPLTPDEHAALERSLLSEGCRDALVLWGDVLVDGHNRYGICQQHNIPFQTLQSTLFKSFDDVHLWMIDQHLGRRSVSDFQRGVLALRKREILNERKQQATAALGSDSPAPTEQAPGAEPATAEVPAIASRQDLAKAARLSSSQVVMIEKIQKQATPALVAAVKSGVISINAAAAVATLPEQEQELAASGGKEQLLQAAKRVRENRKRVRLYDSEAPAAAADAVQALQSRIAVLEAENAELRQQLAALRA
jgi:hypothetical protein